MHRTAAAHITEGNSALLATAIHAGCAMRPAVLRHCALSSGERLREEDPFTDHWTSIADNRVVGLRSRFEVDLNRSRDKALYQRPEDAWGLHVWRTPLPRMEIDTSLAVYDGFHAMVAAQVERLLAQHAFVVVYDLHSYNHQRGGPGNHDAQEKNPEINIGTGNLDRIKWAPVVEALIAGLRAPFQGAAADVRENVKFKGGHFGAWLHGRFGARVCPLAIEFKKTFMDEWTGVPDPRAVARIRDLLARSVPPVMHAAHGLHRSG